MKVKCLANGKVVDVHDRAAGVYLANGWEEVTKNERSDDAKPKPGTGRATSRKPSQRKSKAKG